MRLLLSITIFFSSLSLVAQPSDWKHVYDGFYLNAEQVPGGSDFTLEGDVAPESLVFPLPDGTYNLYIGSLTQQQPKISKYLQFKQSKTNVEIKQGSRIDLVGGSTTQALILIDTAGLKTPPAIFSAGESWSMFSSGKYWYCYAQENNWSIGDYYFTVKAGQVLKLNNIIINYKPDGLFGEVIEPEVPLLITLTSVNFSAQGGTKADNGNNTGVKVEGSVIGFINGGDWIRFSSIQFRNHTTFKFTYSNGITFTDDRVMELRLGSITGTVIGTFKATSTGNWNTFVEKEIAFTQPVSGDHDLYITFTTTLTTNNDYVLNIGPTIEIR